jgi:hypothetical protein
MSKHVQINKTVPVSREDYDQIADQRDAFRAALETAETYLEGVLSALADTEEPLKDAENSDPSDLAEYVHDVRLDIGTAERLARHGLDAVKKALKSQR